MNFAAYRRLYDLIWYRRCGCTVGSYAMTLGAGCGGYAIVECDCGATWAVRM